MKLPHFFFRSSSGFNLSVVALVTLLQRTPVLRVAATAGEFVIASPAGAWLRSAVTAVASLGALHTLAGATQFVQSPGNPVRGTVGQPLSVAFTITGSPQAPNSFTINDPLPGGLRTIPEMQGNTVFSGRPVIAGTPTVAGTFSVSVTGSDGAYTEDDTIVFIIAAGAATAPAITTQPSGQTVAAGASVTFTVVATSSPAPTFQWRKDTVAITGATNATLTLTNVQAANAGVYSVVVTNTAGSVTSGNATLTINAAPPVAPVFSAQPASQTIASGGTVVFNALATGATSYQWRRDGASLAGATSASLILTGASAIAGSYTVVATNATGSATSTAASLALSSTSDVGRLINLAIRTNAGTGAQTLIVGFAAGGAGTSGTKPLLLRGVGPALTQFGLTGVLADPVATLFQGTATVAANDNWLGDAQIVARTAQVGAFSFASVASADAALALSPASGSYTMQITGKNNGTGIALAEIYDATATGSFSATTPRLVNVSARTQVGTGGDILIAGFVVGGSTSTTVLIRAIGPTLGVFGVTGTLVDPKLQLFSGATVIQENDDWGGNAQIASVSASVGAFALASATSKDAVLLVTLPPGGYTAQIIGVNNGTGVALVEVYEVP